MGRFEINGNRRFSVEELSTFFPFGRAVIAGAGETVGVPFSRASWAAATERLATLYQNNGYILSSVTPEETRRTGPDSTPYVDLKWSIREGQPADINRIIIVGNDVTHERVIREAIVMLPGHTYNRDALIRSYENVSNLNFFQQPMPPPDVQPSENGVTSTSCSGSPSGEPATSISARRWVRASGVGGFIGLEEPNLFGKAKRGKLQWQFGRNINDFNLSYTDPAILDTRTSGTISVFNSRRRFTIGDLGRRRQRGTPAARFPAVRLPVHQDVTVPPLLSRSATAKRRRDLSQGSSATTAPVLPSAWRGARHPDRAALRRGGQSLTVSAEQNGGVAGRHRRLPEDRCRGPLVHSLGRLGGGDQFGGGIQFTLGLTAKSGFVIGDAGPFYTELYSMGGVQFGIPLRGYEEFAITPAGSTWPRAATRASPYSFGKAYAAFTVELGARISQALYAQHFIDAGNVYRDAGVQSGPAVPERRLRGGDHLAAWADRARHRVRSRQGRISWASPSRRGSCISVWGISSDAVRMGRAGQITLMEVSHEGRRQGCGAGI